MKKGEKKKTKENKAKRQGDDKVSLKSTHTQNIRLPTKVFICTYKYQITDQTVCVLLPGNDCLHCSWVTVITATLLSQERKEAW